MSDYGTIGHHRLAAISDLDRSIIRQRIRRVEHNLMVYPRPKMDAPGLFGGICTCGDWESAPGSVREVASSWEQHQEAKTSVDSG